MKKSLFSVLLVSMLLVLASCEPVVKQKVVVEPDSLSLYVGDTYSLKASIDAASVATGIVWSSSDANVASVDANGQVTAVAEGVATILASAEGVESGVCLVNVSNIPSAFPRKYMIEHFTGDQCGYCPGGMYAITNYILQNEPNAIWVSHHYGYNQDEYTIPENSKIGKMLGVTGAPNMSLNRTKQSPGMAFVPVYLQQIAISDAKTASASVSINHTFDAESRALNLTVSGHVVDSTSDKYLLSVLIKENRLVGRQADYDYSWKTATWKEYMHARVVRAFVTSHFGDTIVVENNRYSKSFTYNVSSDWVAENCCVVAYLTPLSKKPIINAEQAPLVAGTTGGEEYYPYGITEGKGPNTTVTLDSVHAAKIGDNLLEVKLFSSKSVKTYAGSSKPVVIVHLNTSATTLEAGTYIIQTDNAMGSITAGYRVDEMCTLGGSRLVYALSSDLAKGTVSPVHQWRINAGDMVVADNGNINLTFETYSGTIVTAKLEKAE